MKEEEESDLFVILGLQKFDSTDLDAFPFWF